jgi:hypothetical protein
MGSNGVRQLEYFPRENKRNEKSMIIILTLSMFFSYLFKAHSEKVKILNFTSFFTCIFLYGDNKI